MSNYLEERLKEGELVPIRDENHMKFIPGIVKEDDPTFDEELD